MDPLEQGDEAVVVALVGKSIPQWTAASAPSATKSPVRPLVSEERMQEILAARKPISTEECYRQIDQHLGRPMRRARKPVSFNGQTVWVFC